MAHKCKEGRYQGETCLTKEGYPITKRKKLSCKRVRNAAARGSQQGVIPTLKKNGLCRYIRRCKIESDVCIR